MANTKKSILIVPDRYLDVAVDVTGEASPITLEAMGVPASEITSGAVNTTSGIASNQVNDVYDAAQVGIVTVDLAITPTPTDYYVTIIDVTSGMQTFPRRTFTGATPTILKDAINNATLEAGDGKVYTCSISSDELTITFPANVIAKVAASDGAVIASTQDVVLQKGYTTAEAIAYCMDGIADQYGRTNRVGFPVVEPNVAATFATVDSTAITWDLFVFTKVSDVKFDKNVGASYQDVETFELLLPNGKWATATPLSNDEA